MNVSIPSIPVYIGNARHCIESVVVHAPGPPTQETIDACCRAVRNRKIDLIGADVPNDDRLEAFSLATVPYLRCLVAGHWIAVHIRRRGSAWVCVTVAHTAVAPAVHPQRPRPATGRH